MSLKEQLDSDLKSALLSGDKVLVTTLRGLKSVLLNAEIAMGKRDVGLDDAEVITLLRKELKKRQESAELYTQGGDKGRAEAELNEIKAIEKYLPQQISDEALEKAVDQALSEIDQPSVQQMGKIIARAKELTQGGADGSRIAAAVKRKVAP